MRWPLVLQSTESHFHDRSVSRGQKLSRRAAEERGCKILSRCSTRVLASRPRVPIFREPDFHLLSQPRRAAQKIELVISCQSRNFSTEASGASTPSLSRFSARPGRLRIEQFAIRSRAYAAVQLLASTA